MSETEVQTGVSRSRRLMPTIRLWSALKPKPVTPLEEDHPLFGVRDEMKKLRLQRLLGPICFLPFGYLFVLGMKLWGRYSIEDVQNLRREFRKIARSPGPLLICGNHLTYIDSAILIWALAPNYWYFLNYKKLSWNLPAGDFFKKKMHFRVVAFLFKCIFIDRKGSKQHHTAVLNTARHLMNSGHIVTVFPEGQRSRTGRFETDKMTYGVGKILSKMENPRVLCVYLRSHKQETFGPYPPKGSRFRVFMKLIEPRTTQTGREAYADYVNQISREIKAFENTYFSERSSQSTQTH